MHKYDKVGLSRIVATVASCALMVTAITAHYAFGKASGTAQVFEPNDNF